MENLDATTILRHVLSALCQNNKVNDKPGDETTCKLNIRDTDMKYDNHVVLAKSHLDNTISYGLKNGECRCPDGGARIGHLAVQYLVVVSTMFCIGADILSVTPQTVDHTGCNDNLVTSFTSKETFEIDATNMLAFINQSVTIPSCISIGINGTALTVKLEDGPPITQDLNALCISPIMTVLILLNFVMSDAVDRLITRKSNGTFRPKGQPIWDEFVKDASCHKDPTASLQPPSVPPPVAGPQQADNLLSDDENASPPSPGLTQPARS